MLPMMILSKMSMMVVDQMFAMSMFVMVIVVTTLTDTEHQCDYNIDCHGNGGLILLSFLTHLAVKAAKASGGKPTG